MRQDPKKQLPKGVEKTLIGTYKVQSSLFTDTQRARINEKYGSVSMTVVVPPEKIDDVLSHLKR